MITPNNDNDSQAGSARRGREFAAVIEAVHAELAALAEIIDPAKVRSFVLAIERSQESFDRWEQNAAGVLKDAVSARGLIVPLSQMSFQDFAAFVRCYAEQGDASVVALVLRHYDEIFGAQNFLARLESDWTSSPLLVRRLPLLREALRAHALGMFAVSIPTLIAQFEGLVADVGNHKGRMSGEHVNAHIAKLVAGDNVTGKMLASFVREAFFARFEHGTGVAHAPFSRHAILHGGDVDYATEINSRTAIFLIDHLKMTVEED